MPDRPVVVPQFGEWLRKAREARSLSTGQVELLVMQRFGIPLSHAALWRYEAGQVGSPDPAILWALSRVYRVGLDEMLSCLARDRARRPLSREDLEPMHVTDRSAGITDDGIAVARTFDQLDDDQRTIVSTLVTMAEELKRKRESAMRFRKKTQAER